MVRNVRGGQQWIWQLGCAGVLGLTGSVLAGSTATLALMVSDVPPEPEGVVLFEESFQKTIALSPVNPVHVDRAQEGNWLYRMFKVESWPWTGAEAHRLQPRKRGMLENDFWTVLEKLTPPSALSSFWDEETKPQGQRDASPFSLPIAASDLANKSAETEKTKNSHGFLFPSDVATLGSREFLLPSDVATLDSDGFLFSSDVAALDSGRFLSSSDAAAFVPPNAIRTVLPTIEPVPLVQPIQPILTLNDAPVRLAQLSPDIEPPSRAPQPEPKAPDSSPEPVFSPIPNVEPQPGLPPESVPTTVVVDQFEVIGSTVFSPEELAAVTSEFQGKSLSFRELLAVAEAITQLYIEAGYITSGAFLPEQKLVDGVVEIQVVEGGLETIEVTGTRGLSPGYVRSRLAAATKAPLNRERLLEALQLLQRDPLIETLSTELSASPEFGLSRLTVAVQESRSFYIEGFLDNGRSPSVGSFRRGVQIRHWNLSGQGDRAEATYTNTDGSNGLTLSYRRFLNAGNGTLSAAFGVTASDVIEPPFDVLEIESDSRFYELTFRQPLIQTPAEEFALGLTFSRQESETELLGFAFPLSVGADEEGRTRVSVLRFFQDWTRRDDRQVFSLRSQFSLGVDFFGATINENQPDSRFFSWRGQAQWVRLLAPDMLFLLQGDVQLADGSLLSLEQFGLGGLDRLRGYRQDFLLTDSGVFASAELRLPIVRAADGTGSLQIAPFVDFGTGWNVGSADPDPSTLVSAGLGLRAQFNDRFTARFDWGIPLVSVDSSDRTWQENGLLFSMNYALF